MRRGDRASQFRAVPAKNSQMLSEINAMQGNTAPSPRICVVRSPAPRSTNWGRAATKNTMVFGFVSPTKKTVRYDAASGPPRFQLGGSCLGHARKKAWLRNESGVGVGSDRSSTEVPNFAEPSLRRIHCCLRRRKSATNFRMRKIMGSPPGEFRSEAGRARSVGAPMRNHEPNSEYWRRSTGASCSSIRFHRSLIRSFQFRRAASTPVQLLLAQRPRDSTGVSRERARSVSW